MSVKRRKRIARNAEQLRTELLSLCESFAADGRLVPAEVEALRAWLRDSAGVGLPQQLRNVVSRVIVTARLTGDERREVNRSIGSGEPVESAETLDAHSAVAHRLSRAARRPWALFVGMIGVAALAAILSYH